MWSRWSTVRRGTGRVVAVVVLLCGCSSSSGNTKPGDAGSLSVATVRAARDTLSHVNPNSASKACLLGDPTTLAPGLPMPALKEVSGSLQSVTIWCEAKDSLTNEKAGVRVIASISQSDPESLIKNDSPKSKLSQATPLGSGQITYGEMTQVVGSGAQQLTIQVLHGVWQSEGVTVFVRLAAGQNLPDDLLGQGRDWIAHAVAEVVSRVAKLTPPT